MIIRTIEIDTEEHAKELDEILSKLSYVKTSRKISVKDIILENDKVKHTQFQNC